MYLRNEKIKLIWVGSVTFQAQTRRTSALLKLSHFSVLIAGGRSWTCKWVSYNTKMKLMYLHSTVVSAVNGSSSDWDLYYPTHELFQDNNFADVRVTFFCFLENCVSSYPSMKKKQQRTCNLNILHCEVKTLTYFFIFWMCCLRTT